MAPQKINVKERVSDGEIDLSMSDLQEVPVKDIAVFKKAFSLDLSNNHLKTLPVSFSTSLGHLLKLDLSKNNLTALPDNFGELSKLKHLDLYQNQLQYIPLSFSKLKALKWLDLKDNPLVPAVAKVAGPCIDTKECQTCAKDVVSFFQQVEDQVANDLEIRQKQRQKQLEVNQQKQMENKKNNKKKEKVKPKKENAPVKEVPVKAATGAAPKKGKKPAVAAAGAEQTKKSCFSLCKLFTNFIVLGILSLFILTSIKYHRTLCVEESVVNMFTQGVSSLPPNLQLYAEQAGGFVKLTHEHTGNVTLALVQYVQSKENLANAYNATALYIEGFLQNVKKQYQKFVS